MWTSRTALTRHVVFSIQLPAWLWSSWHPHEVLCLDLRCLHVILYSTCLPSWRVCWRWTSGSQRTLALVAAHFSQALEHQSLHLVLFTGVDCLMGIRRRGAVAVDCCTTKPTLFIVFSFPFYLSRWRCNQSSDDKSFHHLRNVSGYTHS